MKPVDILHSAGVTRVRQQKQLFFKVYLKPHRALQALIKGEKLQQWNIILPKYSPAAQIPNSSTNVYNTNDEMGTDSDSDISNISEVPTLTLDKDNNRTPMEPDDIEPVYITSPLLDEQEKYNDKAEFIFKDWKEHLQAATFNRL